MNSFCDQLIRLATHQPAKGRTMSARKEFNHLMRSMPLRWVLAGPAFAGSVLCEVVPPTAPARSALRVHYRAMHCLSPYRLHPLFAPTLLAGTR